LPDTGDFDVGLINEPAVPDTVSAWSRRVDEQWCEALSPSIDRDVVDLNPAFGGEFFDVAVGQALAEIPADSQQDHVWRKPIPRKRNRTARTIR
jgi:hypothetical protein